MARIVLNLVSPFQFCIWACCPYACDGKIRKLMAHGVPIGDRVRIMKTLLTNNETPASHGKSRFGQWTCLRLQCLSLTFENHRARAIDRISQTRCLINQFESNFDSTRSLAQEGLAYQMDSNDTSLITPCEGNQGAIQRGLRPSLTP